MVKAVFDELARERPKNHFTIGITTTSPTPASTTTRPSPPKPRRRCAAIFYGLGSDGTVGANKNSIKIIGEETGQLRAGLLRLRLEEVGLDDRLAPALRAASRSTRPT